jgi:hypothetical protein
MKEQTDGGEEGIGVTLSDQSAAGTTMTTQQRSPVFQGKEVASTVAGEHDMRDLLAQSEDGRRL